MNSAITIFNLFIIANHIIIAFVLWFRSNNNPANILLGILLFLPVFALATNILVFSDYIHHFFILFFLTPPLMMLFGPVLFTYLTLLMGYKVNINRRFMLHLVPSMILFLAGIWMMYSSFDKEKFI